MTVCVRVCVRAVLIFCTYLLRTLTDLLAYCINLLCVCARTVLTFLECRYACRPDGRYLSQSLVISRNLSQSLATLTIPLSLSHNLSLTISRNLSHNLVISHKISFTISHNLSRKISHTISHNLFLAISLSLSRAISLSHTISLTISLNLSQSLSHTIS